MIVNFKETQLLDIDGSMAPESERNTLAKNIAIVIWKEAADPTLSDIGKELYANGEAVITAGQLESIKQIIEKNSLGFPPITVRYISTYLNSL